MPDTLRPMRADARRNRERILEVAFATFAAEGLSVPVQEIARRAGVGTGTVSRHFPTKESLFEAVVLNRAAGLAEQAARFGRKDDAGAAFFEYFALLIAEGAANLGMAEALMGAGYDLDEVCLRDGIDLRGALNDLLVRAQRRRRGPRRRQPRRREGAHDQLPVQDAHASGPRGPRPHDRDRDRGPQELITSPPR